MTYCIMLLMPSREKVVYKKIEKVQIKSTYPIHSNTKLNQDF